MKISLGIAYKELTHERYHKSLGMIKYNRTQLIASSSGTINFLDLTLDFSVAR